MERNQNYVELWGVAAGEPVFSHENHTRRFDKFPLRVERLSGQNDVPVIVGKKPVLRRTPLGRSICDVILAVNRHYGRADYLPCIAWGQTAVQIAGMDVGERLALEGRVQSRTYTKLLESGSEERTAFEVSIMQLLDEEETEETALL